MDDKSTSMLKVIISINDFPSRTNHAGEALVTKPVIGTNIGKDYKNITLLKTTESRLNLVAMVR